MDNGSPIKLNPIAGFSKIIEVQPQELTSEVKYSVLEPNIALKFPSGKIVVTDGVSNVLALSQMESNVNSIIHVDVAGNIILPDYIGVPGKAGFGVGIYGGDDLDALGLTPLPDYDEPHHDNYGNYRHKEGAYVVYIPAFYYRIGNPNAAKYATYGANTVEIKSLYDYESVAAANEDGFTLHRAFIDGGQIKHGFFHDKYFASLKGNTRADGSEIITSTPGNNALTNRQYWTFIDSARRRGEGYWNVHSCFQYAALAILSLAQAQLSDDTTFCAWWSANGTTSYPQNQAASWNSGNYPNFNADAWTALEKYTHNGQKNGVNIGACTWWSFCLGLTTPGSSATVASANVTEKALFVLKEDVKLADITSGWNGSVSDKDAWGTESFLLNIYDKYLNYGIVNNGDAQHWGNGTNGALFADLSGTGRALCGVLPTNTNAISSSGTNLFGGDNIWGTTRQNLALLVGAYANDGSSAGVFARYLGSWRVLSSVCDGFAVGGYGAW